MRGCDACGVEFEPKSSRHRFCSAGCRRGGARGPNRAALEEQVEALATGREHRALVQACRSLADWVDAGGDYRAWREYRLALKGLREAVSGGGADEFESLVSGLRTEVSDSEDVGS